MPRPTEHITDYSSYSDEAERQRRALIDSLERDEDDVFDSKRGNFQDSRPTTVQDTRPSNYQDRRPGSYQDTRPSDYHDRRYDDLYDRRPDKVYDRRRDDLYDRSRASNGYNDTHRSGSGGYSDSSRASTPRSPERIRADTPSAPPNRMVMPVDIVPPQRDLVPLWDGAPIYGTPDTVASPLDCNRWPSSPYCGGNPFDWKPIGIGVDAVNDGGSAVNKEGCNIGIQITPVVMFVKMPPIQIVARNPWCKPEPPNLPAQPTTVVPENFDGEFGSPGQSYTLYFKVKGITYGNGYFCPAEEGAGGVVVYNMFPGTSAETEYSWEVGAPIRLQILFTRGDESIGYEKPYYEKGGCEVVGSSKTTRYNGYDKQIILSVKGLSGNTVYLYSEKYRISSEYATSVSKFYRENRELNRMWVSSIFDIIDFRLDEIPQTIPRYGIAPGFLPPPWEPPLPPPEPREKRDEECECMCCNDGNTEALMAMLMQQLANQNAQLANQANQIANLQSAITNSTNTIVNNINQHDVDLTPVLNDTSIIKSQLSDTATLAQLTLTENRLGEKIDGIKFDLTPVLDETNLIKEKLDNASVDLTPVLEKLDNIDEDIAKVSGKLGVFPQNVTDGAGGEIKFKDLAELVYKTYILLMGKNEKLIKFIGTPEEVELFDENIEKEGRQPKKLTPQTLFESMALAINRNEFGLKAIGVDMFPITLKPKWDGGLPGLDDKMTMDEALELVVAALTVFDPVSWVIDFRETVAQVPIFLERYLQAHLNYMVPIMPFIDMIQDFINGEEDNKLNNLVELINFTRELVIEANDDDGFPIVVEKEQIDGTEDLLFHTQADAIEEIITLLCNLLKTNGYQTDIGLKCLAESVHTKAIAAMTQGEVRSMADFMDYPSNAVVRPLKIHINCPAKELADGDVDLDGAEDLDKFLAESMIDITFDEWTGKKSLMDMLRDLLNQAASARGDATRRIGG